MTIALATSWTDAAFGSVTPAAERWIHAAQTMGVRACLVQRVPARPRDTGRRLKGAGVSVVGLDVAHGQLHELADLVTAAASLRARHVVVAAPPLDDRAAREAAVEALIRALHPSVRGGAPLALRSAGEERALLRREEATWVLDELPAVGLVLDAAQATIGGEAGWDVGLEAWLDAHASRVVAVLAGGRGAEDTGRRHPEDGSLDWSTLSTRIARGIPWIFDPAEALPPDEVADGLRALRGLRG